MPGLQKPELHCRFPEKGPFSQMLVDLCDFLKPDLSLADGILAMEGNGPTGGRPRKLGVLGASKSPYALDVCAASLMGIRPESVLMQQDAWERGLGPISPEECQLVKEGIEPLSQGDFRKAEASSTDFIDRLPPFLRPAAKRIATPHPQDPPGGVRGLRQVRRKLPPAHHPDPAGEGCDRLQELHTLLLLPRDVPQARDRRKAVGDFAALRGHLRSILRRIAGASSPRAGERRKP